MKSMKNDILFEFNEKQNYFDQFRKKIESLLKDLLTQERIVTHQISSRTKSYDSLAKKIKEKEGKYKRLQDITDIVGIRIVTYLESDVDIIATLIENEFQVDQENSIDKRKLDFDQFGYKSLHIVISLNKKRAGLPEYKQYRILKCEVQIRSILQHAWAEIEHDLGYKGKYEIPEEHKRSFNRLSALLETADIEFDRLKKDLSQYEQVVPELIKENSNEVKINKASLLALLRDNPILISVKQLIIRLTGAEIIDDNDIQGIPGRFEYFDIKTIKDLEDSLSKNNDIFFAFVKELLGASKYEQLPSKLPLYYFQHYLASKKGSPEYIKDYCYYEEPAIFIDEHYISLFINAYKNAQKKIAKPKQRIKTS